MVDVIRIKRMLAERYPGAKFSVQYKSGIDGCLTIATDLIKEFTNEEGKIYWQYNITKEWTPEVENVLKKIELNEKIQDEIRQMLSEYERITRDEVTGEILAGGNVYVVVVPLKTKKGAR